MMAKAPKNLPSVGNRVQWRGHDATGVITSVDKNDWVIVTWDEGHAAPKICHLYELQKLE